MEEKGVNNNNNAGGQATAATNGGANAAIKTSQVDTNGAPITDYQQKYELTTAQV